MAVYRAEATLHDVEVVGGVYDGNLFFHSAGEVYLLARHALPTPASGRGFGLYYGWSWENIVPFPGTPFWVVRTQMIPTDTNSTFGIDTYGDGQIEDPDNPGVTLVLDGSDTQQQTYKGGNVIAIEKDTAAETISWISPVGTITLTFAEVIASGGGTITADMPLLVQAMGHGFLRTGGDAEYEQARWRDFRTLMDDEEIHGHTLESTDPGLWSAWLDVSPASSPVGSQAGPTQVTENAQLSNGYKTRFRYNTADGTRDFYARELRTLQTTVGDGATDMARAVEDALVWQAGVMPYRTHRLRWRRSHVGGRAWEGGTVYEESGKTMEWPSVSYQNGRLLVFWSFDGVVYRSHSRDAGENWSDKVVLDYSGDYPRHIVHPHDPLLLYFFFDGSTLKVARSTDYAETWIDPSPITVDTGLAPQQIDAEWTPDGSVLVSYFDAGAWTQMRSRDAGQTWDP